MAQVGADRLQLLGLLGRDDEVLPLVARREPRGELTQPGRRRLAGAEVEVGGHGCRLSTGGRGQPRDLRRLDDLRHRQPELRGDVGGVLDPAEVGPGLLALGEGGVGGLDQQHRPLAQRERRGAGGRGEDRPLLALLDRPQQVAALGRLDVLEPFEDQRPVLQGADQRRLGHQVALADVAHVQGDQRAVQRGGDQRVGVRAGEHDRQPRGPRQQRAHQRHRLLAPGRVRGDRDHPQARRLRGLVHPPAQQRGGEPVGDLHRALRERRLRVAQQLQRAQVPQAAVEVEGAHHVRRRQALALQQLADEPRRRELARHVVLQVGVEPAVARVELGRGAHREHRGLQRSSPRALTTPASRSSASDAESPCVSFSATSSEM